MLNGRRKILRLYWQEAEECTCKRLTMKECHANRETQDFASLLEDG